MGVLSLFTPGALAQDASPDGARPATDVAPPAEGDVTKRRSKKDAKGSGGKRPNAERAARLKTLLRRYKAMSPEQRKEIQRRYREDLKNRTPEERKRLRRVLARLKKVRRQEKLEGKQKRFRKLPPEQRRRYRKLVEQVIHKLPAEQRKALAELEPAERQRRIKGLLVEHRRRVLETKLTKLPEDVRAEADRSLEGLEGKQRFRKLNRLVEGFVRRRAQDVMRDPSLTPEQKHKQIRQLVQRHLPQGPRRQAMLRKLADRARQAKSRRDRRRGRGADVDRPRGADVDRPRAGRRPGAERGRKGKRGPRDESRKRRDGAGRPGPRRQGSPRGPL